MELAPQLTDRTLELLNLLATLLAFVGKLDSFSLELQIEILRMVGWLVGWLVFDGRGRRGKRKKKKKKKEKKNEQQKYGRCAKLINRAAVR